MSTSSSALGFPAYQPHIQIMNVLAIYDHYKTEAFLFLNIVVVVLYMLEFSGN